MGTIPVRASLKNGLADGCATMAALWAFVGGGAMIQFLVLGSRWQLGDMSTAPLFAHVNMVKTLASFAFDDASACVPSA